LYSTRRIAEQNALCRQVLMGLFQKLSAQIELHANTSSSSILGFFAFVCLWALGMGLFAANRRSFIAAASVGILSHINPATNLHIRQLEVCMLLADSVF